MIGRRRTSPGLYHEARQNTRSIVWQAELAPDDLGGCKLQELLQKIPLSELPLASSAAWKPADSSGELASHLDHLPALQQLL
jgi:hypothetical protein